MMIKLAAAILGFVILNTSSAQAKDALRVTCTENGRIVFKQELPANAGQEERMFVYAKNPNALCIFLQDRPVFVNDQELLGVEDITQGKIDVGTSENTPSNDLATALAMISSGSPSPGSPVDLTDAMQKFRQETGAAKPPSNTDQKKLLNLTIGIYRAVPTRDVIAHWKTMQSQGHALQHLTPTLTNIADITMLSVENISDGDANAICKDAESLGSGCIAFY